ncbi:uncharacterized protein [Epargyreus clarus]|uniref:uncharacterized protein n=1 Tax=Epargyreus clarus TaxID=520877 RepID=UPI003C2E29B4
MASKTVLTLVLCFIQCMNCDSVRENDMDGLINVDHLLRGGSDVRGPESPDFDEDDPSRNIEPEKVFDLESKEDREYDVEIVNPTAIDQRDVTKYTTEVYFTTEAEAIPEALGLKNESIDTQSENNENKMDIDKRANDTDREIDAETTDVTTIDNNVYRKVEDVYSNRDYNVSAETTPSQLSTPQTTDRSTSVPDESLEASPKAEEDETGGQRSPKTETDDTQSADKRSYEKPRPTPALSKSSTLKSWLEDSWLRPPAGILVPLRPLALTRALAVWNDLTVDGLNVTDIVIVGYDSNGVNWRSRHNLQPSSSGNDRAVAQALSKLLLKYQGVYSDASNDGTMRALTSAAKLVPYDSALFVVTDKGAGDPQRMPLALRALVEKRLKVYTIWTDPSYPSAESEQALQDLRNVSAHTEGEVLPYSLQVMDVDTTNNFATEADLQQWSPTTPHRQARVKNYQTAMDMFDTLLVRRGGGEAISVGIPIENGIYALRVYIEGAVDHAVLYPPDDGPQIDLYNQTSVAAFSPASRTNGLSPRDVYLVFPGAKVDIDMLSVVPATPLPMDVSSMVGVWHLSMRCDTCDYRLQVSALSRLHFHTEVGSELLKLRVSGPVASVRESVLVDEYGTELAKLAFNYQPMGNSEPEMEGAAAELDADVPLPSVKGSRVYAKIVGRDIKGEPFVRLSGPINQQSEVRMGRSASIQFPDTKDLERAEEDNSRSYNQKLQNNDSNVLPFGRAISQVVNQRGSILTAVQIGLSTRLYGAPGDSLQLHFEVSNFRETAVRFSFGAVGELRFLRGINPASQTIDSGQTVNVIVSVLVSSAAQPGARDLITFTAYGLEQVSISTYVYVINSGEAVRDVWAPELRHNFQGSCLGRQGSDCAEHTWSASIIARDNVGGLLRISSSPVGLIYESNFIAGTREEVTTSYRATCCNPRVMINAVDAHGNANSYVVDISNYFTEATIAAIVLGVILLIALIALTIFLIYWCVKRRRESRELPSYNTSSRNVS